MADEIKDPNTVSSEEMAALIRGDIQDPRDARPQAEPDIVVSEASEGGAATDGEEASSKEETSQPPELDDRQRLLQTIERLERERSDDRTRIQRLEAAKSEPVVDTVEYLPGVRLPKDVTRLPIYLTPDNLKEVGIEPSPELARGLSILGSALLLRMDAAMRPYVDERYNALNNVRENASRGTASFFDAYPDLVGQDDFIALIEQGARERERVHEIYRGEAYTREIARRVRSRIAAMRGQSLQDYENNLDGGSSTKRPVSRASTTPTRRSGGTPRSTGDQSEIDAVIDGR